MLDRPAYFVVLAAMRTGSNLLERSLATAPDIMAAGELFNPCFIGQPRAGARFGIDLAARDADPLAMLAAMRTAAGDRIPGFRLFPGHDARVMAHVLADPDCARIVLRRNPLDSHLSRRIASEDGIWQVSAGGRMRPGTPVVFDPEAFVAELDETLDFYDTIRTRLARAGLAALWVTYDDLLRDGTLAGIARHVGSRHRPRPARQSVRKQNPEPAIAKVSNPLDLMRTVQLVDRHGLFTWPEFEPARRVRCPDSLIARRARLAFLPIPGTRSGPVADWLQTHEARLAGRPGARLLAPPALRRLTGWLRRNPGHVRFAWADHPLSRAHAVFWADVVRPAGASFARLRAVLARDHGVGLPESWPDAGFGPAEYRAALLGFLRFLPANHARQTVVNVNARWASQTAWLAALPPETAPHHVFRGQGLAAGAAFLEAERGLVPVAPSAPVPAGAAEGFALADIHDGALEDAARRAFARDYAAFGFEDWRPDDG